MGGTGKSLPAPPARVERTILLIRGQKVILDADLARLYEVETRALNQAVRRNRERFPEDFVFQLTPEEKAEVITKCDHLARLKYSPNQPLAFTEHGAIMAASVLNSPRAVEVSVYVVRAFIKLRETIVANKGIARKLVQIERRLAGHDQEIRGLVVAIRELMTPTPPPKRRRIGFLSEGNEQ